MTNTLGIGVAILLFGSLGTLIVVSAIGFWSLWKLKPLLRGQLGNAEWRRRGGHSIGIVECGLFFVMEVTTFSPPFIPRDIALFFALLCGTVLILLCSYKVQRLLPLIRAKQSPTFTQSLVIPILLYSIFNYFLVYANYMLLSR